jgi:hypothetical protein
MPFQLTRSVEDRISGLEDKIDIKEKNRRTLRQKIQKL